MKINNPKISAVILADDTKSIIQTIKSIQGSCFEIIIVDTGMSARLTNQVSKLHKVRLFPFEWIHDFSKARNYGISKAKGDWILTIDSDELLKNKIEFLNDDFIAYLVKQENKDFFCFTARLFRNKKTIRYKNKIHETIDHVLTETNCCNSDIVILHNGYNISEKEMKKKLKRNYDIMFRDKGNVVRNLHLGNYYFTMMKDYKKALGFFRKAEKDKLNDAHFAVIQNNIYACQGMLGFPVEELVKTLRKSLMFEPYQNYARVNIVNNLLNAINENNKKFFIPEIKRELQKLESIQEGSLRHLPATDLLPENFIKEKTAQLKKWENKK